MQGHKIPNPFGAVTDHDLLECAAPAASAGFPIDSTTKLFRTLDGSGVGGGIGIADGIAFLIPRRLGEDASQLGFPSMGRLTFGLALPTDRLFLHHRNSRSRPSAHTGWESARRQRRAGLTAGLS